MKGPARADHVRFRYFSSAYSTVLTTRTVFQRSSCSG